MIVFDLGCHEGHRFEGWFASTGEFERQREGGLLQCPVCGEKAVERMLSAPRLNLTASGGPPPVESERQAQSPQSPQSEEAAARAQMVTAQTAFYHHLRKMLERSDDVGERFAEEARRIHYQETPERQIHGVATRDETAELLEEGVAILPLPGIVKLKKDLN